MPKSRPRRTLVQTPKGGSLMVRLDNDSKDCLSQAAKLRGISLSDYVRTVTVPQARREVIAAREQTLALTPAEQLAFWNALATPPALSESQKRLGSLMRGEG
jgi:uncharacterized protein (DUF1778 family)